MCGPGARTTSRVAWTLVPGLEYSAPDVCLHSWHIFEALVHDLLELLEGYVGRLEGLEEERVDRLEGLEEDVVCSGAWISLETYC